MDGSNGYSLDQLLTWSREDRLIEGYQKQDDHVVILHKKRKLKLAFTEAERFLRRIFKVRYTAPPEAPALAPSLATRSRLRTGDPTS